MFEKFLKAVGIVTNRYSNREIALQYIMQYAGLWYKWGGDDPSGFDCSGLAIEYLKAAEKFPRKTDITADGLWQMFDSRKIDKPHRGCLVFWENSEKNKIIHVEICLNDKLAIGASGGGSKTRTTSDAIRHNAFIKIRPIASRNGIAGYIDPWK